MANPEYQALNTLSQLKTSLRELALASNTHAVIANYPTLPPLQIKFPVTTAPTTSANQLVWQSEGMNLMKIIPFVSNSISGNTYTGLSAKIIGWNITTDGLTKLYVPQQIADISLIAAASSTAFTITTPAATVQTFQNIQECSVNYGDAKLFNSDPTAGHETPAWLVIDTAGCALISMTWYAGTAVGTNRANAFWSSL